MAPHPSPNPSPARPFGCMLILLIVALICGSLFWGPAVTLDDIEIPAAKSPNCQALALGGNSGPALKIGESGLGLGE